MRKHTRSNSSVVTSNRVYHSGLAGSRTPRSRAARKMALQAMVAGEYRTIRSRRKLQAATQCSALAWCVSRVREGRPVSRCAVAVRTCR